MVYLKFQYPNFGYVYYAVVRPLFTILKGTTYLLVEVDFTLFSK
jgi:hypothetical protein